MMQGGAWTAGRPGSALDDAMAQARNALASGRFERVRVEQVFTDPSANRTVTTTVFEQAGTPQATSNLGVWGLLGMAVLLGIGAFFVTRFFLSGGLAS
ncbi:hypothetical protein N826_11845 [Skermanella aerolata KACC 11604]|nr:hypothetical protein N826_11845 [Skermanella aerolata KACC 11604]